MPTDLLDALKELANLLVPVVITFIVHRFFPGARILPGPDLAPLPPKPEKK